MPKNYTIIIRFLRNAQKSCENYATLEIGVSRVLRSLKSSLTSLNGTSLVRNLVFIGLLIVLVLSSFFYQAPSVNAAAGINEQINFQGKIVAATGGTNIADGNYDIEFKVHDHDTNSGGGIGACSGSCLWREAHDNVTVTDGIFRVALGSVTAFGSSVDWNSDTLYLSIMVNADGETTEPEMSPRVRFSAVPYAFNAKQVNGLTVTNSAGDLTAVPGADGALTLNTSGNGNGLTLNTATGASGNSGNILIQTGGTATSGISGSITVDVGSGASSNGTISIGTTNASGLSIGRSSAGLTTASGGTSSWTNTSGDLTISTVTSGNLALTSIGNLTDTFGGSSAYSLTDGTTSFLGVSTADVLTLRTARATGGTTNEAMLFTSASNYGATDEFLEISDAGGSLFRVLGTGNIQLPVFATANQVMYISDTSGTVAAISPNAGATQCLTQASSAAPAWGPCGNIAADSLDFDDFINGMTVDENTTIASTLSDITLDLNVAPGAGSTGTYTGLEISTSWANQIHANDITTIGLTLNPTTNGNADSGDTLLGLNIGSITGTVGSEFGIRIDSGWDASVLGVSTLSLKSSLAAGNTTTEAILLSSTNALNDADELLQIGENGATPFVTVLGSGNVGVGLINPGSLLHIKKDQNALTQLGVENTTQGASAAVDITFVAEAVAGGFRAYSTTYATAGLADSVALFAASTASNGMNIVNDGSVPIKFHIGGVTSTSEKMRVDGGGNIGINDTSPDALLDVSFSATSGTIAQLGSPDSTVTLAGTLIGQAINLATNYTTTNQDSTGIDIDLIGTSGTVTNTGTSGSDNVLGLVISSGGAALSQNGSGGTTNFRSIDLTLPAVSVGASGGTLNADGLRITTGTLTETAGTVTANGINFAFGSAGANSELNGINFGNSAGGASTAESAIKIGTGWDDGLVITGNSSQTTQQAIDISGFSFNHSITESVNLTSVAFTEGTTSSGTTTTTTGLSVSPTVNAGSGTAVRTINGIEVAPTLTSCAAGSCAVRGIQIGNVVDATGFTSTGLNIGTGWDTGVAVASGGITISGGTFQYTGSARPSRKIVLSAEYEGAAFFGDGSNNTGNLTSDYTNSETSANGNRTTYYEWNSTTATPLQDYTVIVRFTLPDNFDAWHDSLSPIIFDYATETTSSSNSQVDYSVYLETASSADATDLDNVSSVAAEWTSTSGITTASLGDCNAAGETCVIEISVQSMNNNYVRIGDITLNYLGKH